MNKKLFLHDKWEFALQSKVKNEQGIKYQKWYKADIPGTVYHNLLLNKLIPDPFYGDNELKLQWIAESDWNYKTTFNFPGEFNQDEPVYLVFDGIDTAAEIYLNNEKVGTPENMFISYKYDVTKFLKEKKNTLQINFTSPYKYAQALERQYGKLPVALTSERVYIRKAQYSFGWDWGPSFADMGLWKPVYLLQEEKHYIQNITFNTLSVDDDIAKVELKIDFNKELEDDNKVLVEISNHRFYINHSNKRSVSGTFEINNPLLWWPNGEGEQHLYKMVVTLLMNDSHEDSVTKKIGLRTIRLQLKEEEENTFRFIVNGKKIFARGCNWIPADSFLTRINDKKYSDLLTLAKDANMNFIRVWGGGIYEHDKFYELCDELGLLVWQDFMFACASYPEYQDYLLNVAEEVKQNVHRIQYHPSIAIWCGNNENEWLYYQEKKKSFKEMPGYKIYNRIIPQILKDIDPNRPFWQSSPFGFDEDPNSVTSGNRHQWDMWSRWIDYGSVKNDKSLFVTEFGFQGPANQSTLEKVIPPEERTPQSYMFEFHNKQIEGNERQFKFLAGHLPVRSEWNNFIYLAQLSQGLALKTCLEQWRYNSPQTNGTVIWQLNDCWPVSSWSLIDSDLKPKLSYYIVKQSFQPQFIKYITVNDELKIFLIGNDTDFTGYFELHEIKLPGGKAELIARKKIKPEGNKSLIFSNLIGNDLKTGKSVLAATFYDRNDNVICRNIFNYCEWKYLKLPKAVIKTKLIKGKKGVYVSVKSSKPAFFVSLFSDDLKFRDNCMTILPGEEIKIGVQDMAKQKFNIKIFSLNDYLI
ncbi:MAG: glycoside hydrolase family 2 TIM barrel-domain containing protein [Ignavibacteriaceae bacterium]